MSSLNINFHLTLVSFLKDFTYNLIGLFVLYLSPSLSLSFPGQPAPPSITHHDASEALEIFWNYKDQGYLSNQWPCKVQYKKQCDQAWTEVSQKGAENKRVFSKTNYLNLVFVFEF